MGACAETPAGFVKSSVILFLNKTDLLREKLRDPKQQIKAYFPEYPGRPGSYEDAYNFFKGEFEAQNHNPGKDLYVQ